jgi:hypothetical protein
MIPCQTSEPASDLSVLPSVKNPECAGLRGLAAVPKSSILPGRTAQAVIILHLETADVP